MPQTSTTSKSTNTASADAFRTTHQLLRKDLEALDKQIIKELHSDVDVINQIGQYIVGSGGKRLRPIMVLLGAGAFGYEGTQHIDLAAVIEFLHTATLLHDDVVDASDLRRGRKTSNFIWGNSASILVGDFLYSRAFQIMTRIRDMRVMEVLSEATNTIAAGEVMQLMNAGNPDTTEASYMEVIRRKTAKLFEAPAQLGPIIAGRSETEVQAMADYGLHFGLAYQLIDDVLDYTVSADEMGKNMGDDLAEGKPTLPLIHAMQHAQPADAELIRNAIKQGGLDDLARIQQIIQTTGSIDYAMNTARTHASQAQRALTNLPASPYRDTMHDLAQFAVTRKH